MWHSWQEIRQRQSQVPALSPAPSCRQNQSWVHNATSRQALAAKFTRDRRAQIELYAGYRVTLSASTGHSVSVRRHTTESVGHRYSD